MLNENRIKLAELVRQNRHELMKVWRNKVQQVQSARNLDTPAAGRHIARLLDDLASALVVSVGTIFDGKDGDFSQVN